MSLLANAVVLLVAVLHVYILVLEMFLWDKPMGLKAFRNTPEKAAETKVLAASRPRSEILAHVTHVAAVQARNLGLGRMVGVLKQSPLRSLLYRPYEASERPRVSAETWAELSLRFEPDIRRLETLLNIRLADWRLPLDRA